MQYSLCRHIKTNGLQCQSPSLSSSDSCYFHTRLLQRDTSFRHTPAPRGYLIPGQHIELTALEDREPVEVAPDVVRTLESTPDGLDLAEPGATLTFLPDEDDDDDEEEEEELKITRGRGRTQ